MTAERFWEQKMSAQQSMRASDLLSLVLRSAKSFTSRKILFFVVWPKFSKFTRNACSMVLLLSSWIPFQTENKSIGEI